MGIKTNITRLGELALEIRQLHADCHRLRKQVGEDCPKTCEICLSLREFAEKREGKENVSMRFGGKAHNNIRSLEGSRGKVGKIYPG
jgi:hypothetical protein